MQDIDFGQQVNGHLIGIAMKEMVSRAMWTIRNLRFGFKETEKESYKEGQDFFTNADTRAQLIYERLIREQFPNFGVIAEEDHLRVQCKHPDGKSVYFTVDPLDGTMAFIRKQSYGMSTMLGLVYEGQIVAVYIGDFMTNEIFGFRHGSNKVHRITSMDEYEQLRIDKEKPLTVQYALLRDDPRRCSPFVQLLTDPKEGLFKGIQVAGGSIGISATQLAKGEVGALILPPYPETPWDSTPVVGLLSKLGFAFVRVSRPHESCEWFRQYVPEVSQEVLERNHETLIIHHSRLRELAEWTRPFVNHI